MQTTLSWNSKHGSVLEPFATRLAIGDEEWREKIVVLDELQAFTTKHAADLTSESLNALVVPFRAMFCELRSAVVKKACDVFGEIATLLRQKTKILVDKVFHALMEARGGSNKVNSQAIHVCIESVLRVVVCKNALTTMFYTFNHTRNGQIRDSCVQYLLIILTSWPANVLDGLKPQIQDCIVNSLSDASPLCREVARSCCGRFMVMWPDKKQECVLCVNAPSQLIPYHICSLLSKLSPNVMKHLAAIMPPPPPTPAKPTIEPVLQMPRRRALHDISNTDKHEPSTKKRRRQRTPESNPADDDDAVKPPTVNLQPHVDRLEQALKEKDVTVSRLLQEVEAMRTEKEARESRMRILEDQANMFEALAKDSQSLEQAKTSEMHHVQTKLASVLKEMKFLSDQLKEHSHARLHHVRTRGRSYSMGCADMKATIKIEQDFVRKTKVEKTQAPHQDTKLVEELEAANAKLRQEMSSTSHHMATVQLENEQLNMQMESMLTQIEALEGSLHEAQDSTPPPTSAISFVDVAIMEEKIAILEARLKQSALKEAAMSALDAEKASLEQGIKELESRLEKADEVSFQAEALAAHISDLEARLKMSEENEAQQKAAVAMAMTEAASKTAELQVQIATLEKEKHDGETLHSASVEEVEQLKQEVAKKESSIDRVKAENHMLQTKVELLLKSIEELQSCIKVTEDAYYQMKDDVSSQSLEEVEHLSAVKAENEGLQQRIQNLLRQLDASEMKNDELRERLAETHAWQRAMESLKAENAQLKSDLEDALNQTQTLTYRMEVAQDATSSIRRDLTTELLAKDAQVMNLTFENQSLHSKVESLLEKVDQLESCVKVTEDAYYQMREDVSSQSLEDVAHVGAVRVENESLQSRIQALVHEVDALEERNRELEAQTSACECSAMGDKVAALAAQVNDVEAKMRVTEEDNAQLRSDLCCQSLMEAEATEKLQHENQLLQIQVQSLQKQLATATANHEAEARQVQAEAGWKAQLEALGAKCDTLAERLMEMEALREDTDDENAKLREGLMVLAAKEAEARDEAKRALAQKATTEHELKAQLRAVEEKTKRVEEKFLAQASKDAETRATLKFENQRLYTRVESLHRQLELHTVQENPLDKTMDLSEIDATTLELSQRDLNLESPNVPLKGATEARISPDVEESKAGASTSSAAAAVVTTKWGHQLFTFREKGALKAQRQLNDANILKRWKPSP
ncbi:Aste57867_11950 [Aphanomyces stellatus]|uniref:Aste57867_11950 protein n=1 Tax=Aphanomyces stellatus TaxID=120398 RepID=A0A485KUD3_9STRA|nr:hypothetical protein As57867_011905 [Aphanomyces stellatus]VFT88805.1 Aste57867_11950 [Aphanomyces stellatus]